MRWGGFGIGISCHSQSPSDVEKKRINVFRALNILNSHIFNWRALLRGLGACIALLARQKNKNSDKNNIPFIGPVARAGRRLIE